MGGTLTALRATIGVGTAVTDEIDLRSWRVLAIQMPADWDTAAITFSSRPSTDDVVQSVVDSGGSEASISVAADQYLIPVDADRIALEGLALTTIRSGTAGVPVNQTADRELVLVVERR